MLNFFSVSFSMGHNIFGHYIKWSGFSFQWCRHIHMFWQKRVMFPLRWSKNIVLLVSFIGRSFWCEFYFAVFINMQISYVKKWERNFAHVHLKHLTRKTDHFVMIIFYLNLFTYIPVCMLQKGKNFKTNFFRQKLFIKHNKKFFFM